MIVNAINTLASFGVFIWMIVLVAGSTDGVVISFMIGYALGTLLNIYFLIVVWSFYKELMESASGPSQPVYAYPA